MTLPPVVLRSPKQHQNIKMAKPDPYADIDFEEITDATGLAIDEIKCLKVGGLKHCYGELDFVTNDECCGQFFLLFCTTMSR